jgi:tight adherence protein B
MSAMTEYLLYALFAAAALLMADGVIRAVNGRLRQKVVQDRLGAATAERRATSLRRLERAEAATLFGSNALGRLYVQAGSPLTAPVLAGVVGMLALMTMALTFMVLRNVPLALLLGAIAGMVLPYFVLTMLRDRRQAAFVALLPDAMDTVVRSLRAGHPLTAAIDLVGRDAVQPLAGEFAAAAQEMALGLDLESAVRNLARRVGAPETDVFATVVSIQQRTGGNLVELMLRLATLLRERARMRAKAKALSSEGRWTALFLSALPFVMFALLMGINPGYYASMTDQTIVAPTLFVTFVWMVVGLFIINRMVNFRV